MTTASFPIELNCYRSQNPTPAVHNGGDETQFEASSGYPELARIGKSPKVLTRLTSPKAKGLACDKIAVPVPFPDVVSCKPEL